MLYSHVADYPYGKTRSWAWGTAAWTTWLWVRTTTVLETAEREVSWKWDVERRAREGVQSLGPE